MVKYNSDRLDSIFGALSDSTRRGILSQLSKREQGVGDLARPYKMSLAAVSKHLRILEAAELIEKTKNGRNYICRANLEPLNAVTEVLEQLGVHWRDKLNSLEEYFLNNKKERNNAGKKNK